MSPHDRLLGDAAVQRFHVEAIAVLAAPTTLPTLQSLAAAVLLLTEDRQARQELAIAEGRAGKC